MPDAVKAAAKFYRVALENERAMYYSDHESSGGSIDLDWLPLSQGYCPRETR